ncbi:LysR family transcriptional regulator [Leisingera sp. ANG-Vp]|uniref:LysR family transcriptional regulator n=1 Tax=Leisingera sp. ANG-Vp TaxID=1577896 RepID=UPI00069159AB|nr:LysR family transcriptional regulator [Leisingera sp. ANG-Vp]
MTETLPPLKALRAFEEAFARRSYTAAAKALNVQQPAVSYQIKRLEEDLGTALFTKERGRLEPTAAANELFDTLSQSFDAIRRTSDRLRQTASASPVTIATYPGIGAYWLSSRLPELSGALGVPARVVTLVKDADLLREDADCRIIFGKGDWPGQDARLLFREQVCAVAAPAQAERVRRAPQGEFPADLPVIEQEDPEHRWIGWDDWLRQTESGLALPAGRTAVNDHGLALHMALSGAGIALAWLGVVEDLLAGGSLVRLSEDTAVSEAGYWLTGRPGFFETRRGRTILKVLTGPQPGSGRT